ncbi:hypothetical protein CPC08DRAFT_800417 [Agrocybe pediades]|nr:hypothetical protein CPC08DRAFT_800417 [Agrocybe pediades]
MTVTAGSPRRNKPLKPETPNWTRTHGFFLQMGGFMLQEEGKEDRVLGWGALKEYYEQGRLDLSEVTADRINDHSKADGFAKGLALLQMFWFITQCVARLFDNNLILTELELATAALALLSFTMYLLWWNKPFNAGIPITLTLLPASSIDTSLPIPDAVSPNIPHTQPVESTHSSSGRRVNEAIPSNFHLRQSDPVNPPAFRLGSADNSNVALSPPPNPQSAHSRVLVHSVQ